MDEKDREIQKTREYNYVLWTVIVVLAIMLVNLFAQKTCNNETFVNQVSFASTLSSIILSVIAIIMTVISNDSISSLLHRFRDLHDEIKDVPTDLKKSLEVIDNSVSKLNEVQEGLSKLPEKLQSLISTTNNNIINLSNVISDISSKTNFVHDTLKGGFYSSKKDNDSSLMHSKNDFYKSLINKSSYWGDCLLYTIFYAQNYSVKSFSLSTFSDRIANRNDKSNYFWGFIIAINATGLIKVKCEGDLIEIFDIDKDFDKQFIYNFILNYFSGNHSSDKFTNPEEDLNKIHDWIKELAHK